MWPPTKPVLVVCPLIRALAVGASALAGCTSEEGPTVADGADTAHNDGDSPGDSGADTNPADTPELEAEPTALSFIGMYVGQTDAAPVTVSNRGSAPVWITASVVGTNAAAYAVTLEDAATDPGASTRLSLTLAPTTWGDHGVDMIVSETTGLARITIPVMAWVQEDGDGDGHGSIGSGGDDCDDTNESVHPGAADTWYDGIDSDCLGDDDFDQDGDGVEVSTDCLDTDAGIHPGAADLWYDGIDANCDGADDFDADGDGFAIDGDCDDTNREINPGQAEVWYDGVDQDCDGRDDDQDDDGFGIADDCDDTNESVHPGAADTWYDGIDSDCLGDDDFDQDGDGVEVSTDCLDTDPTALGPSSDVWDELDNDCDGVVDNVSITTGAAAGLYGATTALELGSRGGLVLGGDLTGDGADDLVVTSFNLDGGYGWVVEGATAASAAGPIDDYDTVALRGAVDFPVGHVLAPMVDVTGDGQADLLIAGTPTSGYHDHAGACLAVGGSSLIGTRGVPTDCDATIDDDYYGYNAVRWAVGGDIDGDGTADVVTAAPQGREYVPAWHSFETLGILSIFLDTPAGTLALGDAEGWLEGGDDGDLLGSAMTIADVDGDGYDDIIAGTSGRRDAGAIYFFSGAATSFGWATSADHAYLARFEGTVTVPAGVDPLATPGDVDGDGSLDLVLTSNASGAAVVFLDAGRATGTIAGESADIFLIGEPDSFGSALVCNADLDGDGVAELVLGDNGDDTAGVDAGAVWVYRLGGTGGGILFTADADLSFFGASAGDRFGSDLASAGDANDDGTPDLVIGAPGNDGAAADGGAVYVVLGR